MDPDDLDPIVILDDEPAAPPITPRLLRDLLAYAVRHVGSGSVALRTLGIDQPELVRAYQIGYCPPDTVAALATADSRALSDHTIADRVVIPAVDEQGLVVDLWLVDAAGTAVGLWDAPRGMLAPTVARDAAAVLITDRIATLVALFRAGSRNVVVLRGPADAQANAARLRGLGVQSAVLHVASDAGDITQPLTAAGITVRTAAAAAAEPEALTFLEEDRTAEVVIWQVGPVRYAVESRDDGATRRQVVIRAHGQTAQDRIDLAVEAQRGRFAANAARRVGLPAATIAAHLAALITAQLAREEAARAAPAVAIAPEDRATGEAFLAAPDLIDRITADCTALGWIGEARTQALLYLTGVSRLLPNPVWSVFRASAGAAPWQSLSVIAALTPPEGRLVLHRCTDALLTQADPRELHHKLLLVDQAETLRPEAALALRILHERGGIGWATAASGSTEGVGGGGPEARGPVAVLAAAAGDLDHRCRDSFLAVAVDESPAQTAQILAVQAQRLAVGIVPSASAQAAIISRHHAAQRLLTRLPVVIPDINRIIFPASRVRHRDEQAWFLSLVAASALLHQRQRVVAAGAIQATEADITLAIRLTDGLIGTTGAGLARQSRHLLEAICAAGLTAVTMADLGPLCPDWSRWAFRAALQDLLDFGYLTSPAGGRGRSRTFTLVPRATTARAGIRLRPATGSVLDAAAVGELAEVGGAVSANFIPARTGT